MKTRIALIAHDKKKDDMITLAGEYLELTHDRIRSAFSVHPDGAPRQGRHARSLRGAQGGNKLRDAWIRVAPRRTAEEEAR